ncbi:MAG TPA: DUF3280 domain-containing protein [Aliidongia sp.]|nr:DUF3280 domain-containing protein [Aliidongia sp.]
MKLRLLWPLVLLGAVHGALAAEPRPAAIFPVELFDTSGEGAKPGQLERLALATRTLTAVLTESGRYRPVDLGPFETEIDALGPRYKCDGCWMGIARKSGAEIAVVPVVHKVSTLISILDIWLVDVSTGQYVAHINGQLRGDTDTAYVRAVDFLIKDRLLGQ